MRHSANDYTYDIAQVKRVSKNKISVQYYGTVQRRHTPLPQVRFRKVYHDRQETEFSFDNDKKYVPWTGWYPRSEIGNVVVGRGLTLNAEGALAKADCEALAPAVVKCHPRVLGSGAYDDSPDSGKKSTKKSKKKKKKKK